MALREVIVLIVGAGITGLLCAQGLKKNNIPFMVWEASPSLFRADEDDWGMGIHWAVPLLASCLPDELMGRIKEAQVDPSYEHPDGDPMPLFNGETGDVMKILPLPPMHRVARARFRSLCASGIDIEFGKSVTGIDATPDTLTVHAESSPSLEGITHVLGADGARSTTRSLLLQDAEAASAPYTATRTLVSYPSASLAQSIRAKTHPINAMAIHPAGIWAWISLLSVPDPAEPTGWVFQLMASWRQPGAEREAVALDELKRRTDAFAEPFRSAFQSIPAGTRVRSNQTSYWEPPAPGWSAASDGKEAGFAGRVQLAGDAAHPMTFHRGQGLNHAVADAAAFVRAMVAARDALREGDGEGCRGALEEYEVEVCKRGGEEVRVSLRNTVMLHDWEMVMESPLMKGGIARS